MHPDSVSVLLQQPLPPIVLEMGVAPDQGWITRDHLDIESQAVLTHGLSDPKANRSIPSMCAHLQQVVPDLGRSARLEAAKDGLVLQPLHHQLGAMLAAPPSAIQDESEGIASVCNPLICWVPTVGQQPVESSPTLEVENDNRRLGDNCEPFLLQLLQELLGLAVLQRLLVEPGVVPVEGCVGVSHHGAPGLEPEGLGDDMDGVRDLRLVLAQFLCTEVVEHVQRIPVHLVLHEVPASLVVSVEDDPGLPGLAVAVEAEASTVGADVREGASE